MNRAWLTVDLEEWYHLDYLDTAICRGTGVRVVPQIFDFLDMLDEEGIRATFFCVGEIADEYSDILRELVRRGHAIGCHGWDHTLLTDKSLEQFEDETLRARDAIEQAAGTRVSGYRGSCFTLDREKLEVLRKLGFEYDSSRIRFEQHPLYRNLDLTGFDPIEDLVYVEDGFSEYEIPTLDIGKYSLPISGGGYLRLFPFWMLRILLGMYSKAHENFTIYVHPFELTPIALPLPKALDFKTRFRCLVGRRRNLRKLQKVIRWLKRHGARFVTMEADRKERGLA